MELAEQVARRVRAWIETPEKYKDEKQLELSHAVCVRGLKLDARQMCRSLSLSHAVCVRGLKLIYSDRERRLAASHAVCVRGLKQK